MAVAASQQLAPRALVGSADAAAAWQGRREARTWCISGQQCAARAPLPVGAEEEWAPGKVVSRQRRPALWRHRGGPGDEATRTRAMRRRLLATRLVLCGVGEAAKRQQPWNECHTTHAGRTGQRSARAGASHGHGGAVVGEAHLPREVRDGKQSQHDVKVHRVERGQQQPQGACCAAICCPGPHGRGVLRRVGTPVSAGGRHKCLLTSASPSLCRVAGAFSTPGVCRHGLGEGHGAVQPRVRCAEWLLLSC